MRVSAILCTCLFLILPTALQARESQREIVLDPSAASASPGLQILAADDGSLRLELRLPALTATDIDAEGERFQALDFPGAEVLGEEGQPGLPAFSRLVLVPEGATVNARVLGSERRALAGFKPFPIQPDEAPSLLMDQAAYAGQTGLTPPPVAEPESSPKAAPLSCLR